jgi:hypothetical protein
MGVIGLQTGVKIASKYGFVKRGREIKNQAGKYFYWPILKKMAL